LTNPQFDQYEDEVQKKVSQYNVVGSFIENGPTIIIALYLGKTQIIIIFDIWQKIILQKISGPLSDQGRKLLMYLPFVGHLISGGFYLLFIYFDQWPAQYLWITYIYNLFGGFSVLQIAMNGYIGDVTTTKYVYYSTSIGVAIFCNDGDFTTLRRQRENKGISQHCRKIVIFHI
jgi:hypothetical protein